MNTVLSICIPTYNRSLFLKTNLQSLISIVRKFEIPIYVSDNCSVDNTENVVQNLQEDYAFLFYDKNKVNKGADFNFEKVLKMSEAKYAWLLGDDDSIDGKFFESVLKVLEQNELDLLVVNGGNTNLKRVRDTETQMYVDPSKLLNDIGWHMQWMSCLIYSRDLIDKADFLKYQNTNLLQYGIIFDYLAKKESIKVYWEKAVVVYNLTNSSESEASVSWAENTFWIFTKSWYQVIHGFPACYSEAAKRKCIMDHGYKSELFNFKGLIKLSLQGIFNLKTLNEYSFYIKQTIKYKRPVLILIACLPTVNKKFFLSIRRFYQNFIK